MFLSPKNPILSYFEGPPPGFWPKNPGFGQFLAQKQHGPKIFLGTIAELLAVLWSINDVCEAQKTCFSAKPAFTMGFAIFKRSYLVETELLFGDQSCSRHIGSMFEYV